MSACQGCGAQYDQSCRFDCPDFKSDFRKAVAPSLARTAEREALRDHIAVRLLAMESMFDERCKLTFVMRAPHLDDGDLVVTSDSIPDVVTALQRLQTYQEIGG